MLRRGVEGSYFNIGVIERYFAKKAKPVKLLGAEDRLAEISKRRNALERQVRIHVKNVFAIQFAKAKRRESLVSKLAERRRSDVADFDFDHLLAQGASPLYFDELKSIIMGYWDKFENSIEMSKTEFEYHMTVVNKARNDAHAKDVQDRDFEKVRVSLAELESKF